MASIKDVTKLAGVASSTASRVLTGDGYTSPETREKVERAAKQLNIGAVKLAVQAQPPSIAFGPRHFCPFDSQQPFAIGIDTNQH